MIIPITSITLNGSQINNDSRIMLMPMAQITCKKMALYKGLKLIPSVTISTSTNTSHRPLLKRKALSSFFVFLRPDKYADELARKANIAAQVSVIIDE